MRPSPAELPVVLLYDRDPAWPGEEKAEVTCLSENLAQALEEAGHTVQTACLEDERLEEVMGSFDPVRQIVFNWCEEIPGIPRSCARVAKELEEMGFTFTGADSESLRLSQDKPEVKQRLVANGIPTPAWKCLGGEDELEWDIFPAIVKPAFEHCSTGITHEAVVQDRDELTARVRATSRAYRQPVLVEDFIDGREFHVSVVGNGRLEVFPIAEMDFSGITAVNGRLCTYDSKFVPASQDYQMIQVHLPAALSPEEERRLEETAIAAYRATNCRDYARMDIRLREGIFYALDVNPNADISPDASLAISAEMAGYSFGQLGSLLVRLAAKRHGARGGRIAVSAPQEPKVSVATS